MAYNGWPNYETWNVMLWMDNDEGAYRCYREKAQRYKDSGRTLRGIAAQNVCRECMGSGTPDGVSFDSSKIRWGKIAEAMREDS